MSRLRWLAACVVIPAVVVLWPASIGHTPVEASHAYYSYPCPLVTGGADFAGIGGENFGVSFDPRTGIWDAFVFGPDPYVAWGSWGDVPVPGDYNGDGTTDVAVWRPSDATWEVRCSSAANCAASTLTVVLGAAGDLPVPADYDHDGVTDYGVWRPTTGEWFVRAGANPTVMLIDGFVNGTYGDCPVPGRLGQPGPGPAVPNVWRPSNGTWYRSYGPPIKFGLYGDLPFARDMDGDEDSDLLIYRPSTGAWYGAEPYFAVLFGQPGDIPIPASGKPGFRVHAGRPSEVAVFRPSSRVFYVCADPAYASNCDLRYIVPRYAPSSASVPLGGRAR